MIYYDEFNNAQYFAFGLTEMEKQNILYQDYLEEIEKEKQKFIAMEGVEEYEYFTQDVA